MTGAWGPSWGATWGQSWGIAAAVVSASTIEPADALDEIDAAVNAGIVSATVAETADARDQPGAVVISRIMALAAYYRPPAPVVGVGYGVLPQLIGAAHGTVYTAGRGEAVLPIRGAAVGEVDDFPTDLELMLLMLAA